MSQIIFEQQVLERALGLYPIAVIPLIVADLCVYIA
jgi:hypothetical protein